MSLNDDHLDTYNSLRARYKGWGNACRVAVGDVDQFYPLLEKTKIFLLRSKKQLLEELDWWYKKHKENPEKYQWDTKCSMYSAISTHFESATDAFKELGIDYWKEIARQDNRQKYDNDTVPVILLGLYEEGFDLSPTNMHAEYGGLFVQAKKIFGTYENALRAAGLSYDSVTRNKQTWKPDEIIAKIQFYYNQGKDISHSSMQIIQNNLLQAAMKHFESWKKAVIAAGIDYETIRKDWQYESYIGSRFEIIGLDVLKLKYKDLDTKKLYYIDDRRLIPDGTARNGELIIDIKYSTYTQNVDDTIAKYKPIGKLLEIVYYKGESREAEYPNVKWTSIESLIGLIKSEHQKNTILKKLRELETLKLYTKSTGYSYKWDRETILHELKALYNANDGRLTPQTIREQHPKLYGAIHKKQHFESMKEVFTVIGLDYDKITREEIENRAQNTLLWTKDKVDLTIQSHPREELSYQRMSKINPTLINSARRYYKKWAHAVEANVNIRYDSLLKVTYMSDEEIIAQIKEIFAMKSYSPYQFGQGFPKLAANAIHHFGTMQAAFEKSGINYQATVKNRSWTKDGLINEVRAKIAKGIKRHEFRTMFPRIYGAGRRLFGSWHELNKEI